MKAVVIPCYHLVWYNNTSGGLECLLVVIPCYHLVWYNGDNEKMA